MSGFNKKIENIGDFLFNILSVCSMLAALVLIPVLVFKLVTIILK